MRTPAQPAYVIPRLFRRTQSASYLNTSPSYFDQLRARGLIQPVRIPSERNPTGYISTPLFDVRDLDALIDTWKGGGDAT